MPEEAVDAIVKQILAKRPEIPQQMLLDRLSASRDMTGGLIADESLMRMIAAELGVDVAGENGEFRGRLSLGHMVAGLNNATVTGRVVAVYPVKTFEGTKPGKLASVTIVDTDGVLRVILWNDKADYIESGTLKVGQIAKFAHGYTKADRNGVVELHMGDKSQVELEPTNVKSEDYPGIGKFSTKIEQITLNHKSVNLSGKVKEVLGSSTFMRGDQSPGKVLRLKLSDESGEVVAVFWNEKADEVETKARRNAQVEIVNARVKHSQNGEVEVHVDNSAYVDVATVARCLIKIATLAEDAGEVCVEGTIGTIPQSREVRTQKGETVRVATFDLKDDSGSVRVNAWREHAETAEKLAVGEKIMLENVYAKRGYNEKVELSTRSATTITRLLD
jgi:ssDNA-binding replication factor A large subunit